MRFEFVEDAPTYRVKDGNVICSWPDRAALCIPLRVFRVAYQRAGKALDAHDSRGEVVPIRRSG